MIKNYFLMLRLFEFFFFCKCKSQISFCGDQNAGHGHRKAEAWRGSERRGDSFAGLGGHFAYLKALEVISKG